MCLASISSVRIWWARRFLWLLTLIHHRRTVPPVPNCIPYPLGAAPDRKSEGGTTDEVNCRLGADHTSPDDERHNLATRICIPDRIPSDICIRIDPTAEPDGIGLHVAPQAWVV